MNERLSVIWTNFGPYHMARIRALKPFFDVKAIELASDQRLYRWWRGDPDDAVYTLTEGDWEDQDRLHVARRVWQTLNRLKPRVILVPGYASLPALSAALWGRVHGAITILMSESNFNDHQRKGSSEALKHFLVTRLFRGGVVGGKCAAAYLQQLGIPQHRIAYGYDVVDNQYFSSHAEQCRSEAGQEKQPYFLFVGRLAKEKNISALIHAHEQYLNSGGTWPLVIVGDGPLGHQLREQAQTQVQAGKVVFAGRKSVHELPPLYAFAGCFVLPSTSEPWGLVVNEAMASGLPVIVSSRCGCKDDLVEEGSNGFIFDPGKPSELAGTLMRVSEISASERKRMGQKSRDIVAAYSPEHWAREVQRLVSIVRRESQPNES